MLEISSPQNQKYKGWLGLLESRGIKDEARFLIFGQKLVIEALKDHKDIVQEIICSDKNSERLDHIGAGTSTDASTAPTYKLKQEIFRELDVFGTKFPILVCSVPKIKAWIENDPAEGIELLLALGNPSNLGAVLRSALAFGAKRVVLLSESAHPLHPKSVRAASGAVLKLQFLKGPSIQEIKNSKDLIGLDSSGKSLKNFSWPSQVRLLLGEEGQGLPARLRSNAISIPQSSDIESLNAAVAASIVLSHRYMQLT